MEHKIGSIFIVIFFIHALLVGQSEKLTIDGLEKPVEIIVDHWGIPHIYAETEPDLFFAQGFYAAKDRLFQFEIWRRQATGTVAEMLGERELRRDIGTRLFKFRGDMEAEMNYYHPRGATIVTSFVRGVNAYIELANKNPENLPIEFKLLNIKPQPWTPEIVISRHQGLLGNIGQELNVGRLVEKLGPEKVKELSYFHPGDPLLEIDAKINAKLLHQDILGLYNAFRRPIRFKPEDIIAAAENKDLNEFEYWAQLQEKQHSQIELEEIWNIGSNNWVVSGNKTQSGFPMMANDPHRSQASPSLRYMAHLVGPGWNVIGGGEPEIPGISIGHNEHGAWGLTVFRTDAEDLYVYKINPDNPNQYWYKGNWENMLLLEETIPVKNKESEVVTLKYTRHGPVVFEDNKNKVAYAIRCGWMEIGGSPYLASLRMDQAKDFEEFREACNYSHIPGENMIWADREGNIGWQSVGIAPIRRNWSGLVPVPGDGSYEWDGYLPIKAKPNVYNPPSGIFVTANENVTPPDYPYMDAIGFSWSDPYRSDRVKEFLLSGRQHGLMDFAALQTDYLSIPARQLVPMLKGIPNLSSELNAIREQLLSWDFHLNANSIEAGIYNMWERKIRDKMEALVLPEDSHSLMRLQMIQIINWLLLPDNKFGSQPIQGRNALLLESLEAAIQELKLQLGPDRSKWQYGQLNYKHVYIKHPLSAAVNEETRKLLDVGPVPRGGNSYTVNNTSSGNNQTHGASFRLIVDTGNWDHTLGTNTPGQGGDPSDKHYRNLFDIWASDQYFPVFYSREKVEGVKDELLELVKFFIWCRYFLSL